MSTPLESQWDYRMIPPFGSMPGTVLKNQESTWNGRDVKTIQEANQGKVKLHAGNPASKEEATPCCTLF